MSTPESQSQSVKVLGICSIVFGGMGFLFCPLIFGTGGLACGVIGIVLAKEQPKTLAIIGTVISAVSIPAGLLLGILVEEILYESESVYYGY